MLSSSWWENIDATNMYISFIWHTLSLSWWDNIDATNIYIAIVLSYTFIHLGGIKLSYEL